MITAVKVLATALALGVAVATAGMILDRDKITFAGLYVIALCMCGVVVVAVMQIWSAA